jgi:hypothetical protein
VSWNSVTASDSNGAATTTSGGIDADGTLVLSDSSVDHNEISSTVPAASGLTATAAGAGIENDGLGLATVRESAIVGNSAVATSATGFVAAGGGAVANISSQVTLERTLVAANTAGAIGAPGGIAEGGGILNITFGSPVLPQLTLTDSLVTANRLGATPGITPAGGGIFSADIFSGNPFPVTLTHTVIAGNSPDQCVGGC